MKPSIRTYLCNDENHRFFGEGPRQLLHAIDETGSLRSAALSMNMAYTKALRIIRSAEATLGFPLTVRTTGGKGGGRPDSAMAGVGDPFLVDVRRVGNNYMKNFFADGNLFFSLLEHKRPLSLVCKIQTMSGSPASSWPPVLENVSAQTSSWLRSTVLRSSTRFWM